MNGEESDDWNWVVKVKERLIKEDPWSTLEDRERKKGVVVSKDRKLSTN